MLYVFTFNNTPKTNQKKEASPKIYHLLDDTGFHGIMSANLCSYEARLHQVDFDESLV